MDEGSRSDERNRRRFFLSERELEIFVLSFFQRDPLLPILVAGCAHHDRVLAGIDRKRHFERADSDRDAIADHGDVRWKGDRCLQREARDALFDVGLSLVHTRKARIAGWDELDRFLPMPPRGRDVTEVLFAIGEVDARAG